MGADPLVLTVPWEMVAADNHRMLPVRVGKAVRLITAPAYRLAKRSAELTLKQQWGRRPKLHGPVELVAVAWFPDNRKRDAGNYRKLLGDALTGIAYADDGQVWSETWKRGGIDRANPRIELCLTPLTTEQAA